MGEGEEGGEAAEGPPRHREEAARNARGRPREGRKGARGRAGRSAGGDQGARGGGGGAREGARAERDLPRARRVARLGQQSPVRGSAAAAREPRPGPRKPCDQHEEHEPLREALKLLPQRNRKFDRGCTEL